MINLILINNHFGMGSLPGRLSPCSTFKPLRASLISSSSGSFSFPCAACSSSYFQASISLSHAGYHIINYLSPSIQYFASIPFLYSLGISIITAPALNYEPNTLPTFRPLLSLMSIAFIDYENSRSTNWLALKLCKSTSIYYYSLSYFSVRIIKGNVYFLTVPTWVVL